MFKKILLIFLVFLILISSVFGAMVGNAHYDFETGSGTTLYDQTNSNDGTIESMTWDSGNYPTFGTTGTGASYSGSFDGTNDQIDLDILELTGTDPFSICFWANLDAYANDYLVSQYGDSSANMIAISSRSSDHKINFRLGATSQGSTDLTTTNTYTTGTWFHYCAIYNGNNNMTVYYDGDYDNSINGLSYTNNFYNTHEMTIGNLRWDATSWTDGNIDEVWIFLDELTSVEIKDLYDCNDITGCIGGGTSERFEIICQNETAGSINNCNATIDSFFYSTTNGTINTPFYDNSTILHNITVKANNYFDYNKIGLNVSSDLTTSLLYYPHITAKNIWNNITINTFNSTINNVTYFTTNGKIYLPLNETKTVITKSSTYETNTTTHNFVNQANLILNLIQSEIKIRAKTILRNQTINNFSIITEKGEYITTNGLIIINPAQANYTWNFTNNVGYYNLTNLNFNVDESRKNFTLINIFSNNYSFLNNLTDTNITPVCNYEGYNVYKPWKIDSINSSNQMECELFGFENLTFTPSTNRPKSEEYKLQPVRLFITFSEKTSGQVTWNGLVNGSEGFSFNTTAFAVQQIYMGLGTVTITYNGGTQLFQYYNDVNTAINQYLQVNQPNFIQPVKLWDGSQTLEGRVTAYKFVNGSFVNVYSAFTNAEGLIYLVIEDSNLYKLVGESEGYETTSQQEYIVPSGETTATEIIYLELTSLTDEVYETLVSTSCPNTLNETTVCTITANSQNEAYNFRYQVEGNTSYNTTFADSISSTLTLTVSNTTTDENKNIIVKIYKNEEYVQTITLKYRETTNDNLNVGLLTDLREAVNDNKIGFIIMVIIISVIIGYFAEQKFEGQGYNAAVLMIGALGILMPVLWAICLLYIVWSVYDSYKNIGGS